MFELINDIIFQQGCLLFSVTIIIFWQCLFSDMAFEIKSFTDKQQYIKHMYFIRLVTVGFYFLSNLLKNCNA
jgi:hypothetical protein